MTFLAWILLVLIAGFLGTKIVNWHGDYAILDMGLGIVGAIAGGFLFQLVGAKGMTGLNLWSLMVATTGAVMLLIVFNAIRQAVNARH